MVTLPCAPPTLPHKPIAFSYFPDGQRAAPTVVEQHPGSAIPIHWELPEEISASYKL
jgi:hypothetical protein